MRILQTTNAHLDSLFTGKPDKAWNKVHRADVIIADGVVIKNREGHTGARVGGSIFAWDEEVVSESGVPCAMSG